MFKPVLKFCNPFKISLICYYIYCKANNIYKNAILVYL